MSVPKAGTTWLGPETNYSTPCEADFGENLSFQILKQNLSSSCLSFLGASTHLSALSPLPQEFKTHESKTLCLCRHWWLPNAHNWFCILHIDFSPGAQRLLDQQCFLPWFRQKNSSRSQVILNSLSTFHFPNLVQLLYSASYLRYRFI